MKPMNSEIDSFDSASSSEKEDDGKKSEGNTSSESARMDTEEMEKLLS